MTSETILRFYPVARSKYLEAARTLPPATWAYMVTRRDWDTTLDPAGLGFRRVSLAGLLRLVATTDYDIVQVTDPMWARYAPHSLAVLVVVRLRDLVRRRRTRTVAPSIENALITQTPRPVRHFGSMWTWAARRSVRMLATRLDRVMFGSTGAEAAFLHALGPAPLRHLPETRVVEHLYTMCECPTAKREPALVAFVGQLEVRKGLHLLLAAWPAVRAAIPEAHLVLAGDGPMSETIRSEAAADSSIEPVGVLNRDRIHDLYRRASVVALLSQPEFGWREQIGLAIPEGAAHGCRIVATDQTGLATWLIGQGQHVVPTHATTSAIASAIIHALTEARRDPVAAYRLPTIDHWTVMDRWWRAPAVPVAATT